MRYEAHRSQETSFSTKKAGFFAEIAAAFAGFAALVSVIQRGSDQPADDTDCYGKESPCRKGNSKSQDYNHVGRKVDENLAQIYCGTQEQEHGYESAGGNS